MLNEPDHRYVPCAQSDSTHMILCSKNEMFSNFGSLCDFYLLNHIALSFLDIALMFPSYSSYQNHS